MGTNFYIKSRKIIHVGKRSMEKFMWAIPPAEFIQKIIKKPSLIVKDEYNRIHSLKEFGKILEECTIQSYDMIGKGFR